MTTFLTRFGVCLGIVGSWAIATSAGAQVPVTGGRITGNAGFFVPVAGDTVFFDAATRTLRLETPNGVTVDSRFVPTFAELEAIGNRIPARGDTARIEGVLSGRAFDGAGNPFPFANVPTSLNVTFRQFVNNLGGVSGTLIRPNDPSAAAQLFLPVTNVILSSEATNTFTSTDGRLVVGEFDAAIARGLIDLPPTTQFGTPLVTEFAVPDTVVAFQRGLEFELAGVGDPNPPGTPGDPLGSFIDPFVTGSVRFSSPSTNTLFRIQLQGTPLTITGQGVFGTVVEVTGINPSTVAASSILPGNNPLAPAVQFTVRGTGSGTISNTSPLGFRSDVSATNFRFEDADRNFISGFGVGSTFFGVSGVLGAPFTASSFTGLTPDPRFNSFSVDNQAVFVAAPVLPPAISTVGGGAGSGGSGGTGGAGTGGTGTAGGAGSTFNTPVTFIPTFSPVYGYILQPVAPVNQVFINSTGDVVTINRGNGNLVAFATPGLGSRVFPGLTGVEPVPVNFGNIPVGSVSSIDMAQSLANQINTAQFSSNPLAVFTGLGRNLAGLSTQLHAEALASSPFIPTQATGLANQAATFQLSNNPIQSLLNFSGGLNTFLNQQVVDQAALVQTGNLGITPNQAILGNLFAGVDSLVSTSQPLIQSFAQSVPQFPSTLGAQSSLLIAQANGAAQAGFDALNETIRGLQNPGAGRPSTPRTGNNFTQDFLFREMPGGSNFLFRHVMNGLEGRSTADGDPSVFGI